ncbi:hypothetical protein [Embleya sp. NPDC001921]
MWIVVLLVVFAPVGIFLMWKYTDWQRPLKIGAAIVSAVVFLVAFSSGLSGGGDGDSGDKVTPASTSTSVPSGAATTPAPGATTAPKNAPSASTAPADPPPASPAQEEANTPKPNTPKADPPKTDPPKNDPPPADGGVQVRGRFCSQLGATAVNNKGESLVCANSTNGSKRWT